MTSEFSLPSEKEQKFYDNINSHKNKFINTINSPFKNNIDNPTLQVLFNKNLNTLPFNYKLNLFKTVTSENLINEIILSYEIKNLNIPKEIKNNSELKKFVNYSLLRYKPLVEKYFKFSNWKIWNLPFSHFSLLSLSDYEKEIEKLNNSCTIFYNIVNNDELKKNKFKERIDDIFNFFNRSITNYIIRSEKYKIERDNLSYIFLIFFQT